jgi:cell division protein FtsQ
MWNNVRHLNLAASALYALWLAAMVVAGGYWLIQRPAFTLHAISVDGDTEHVSEQAVRDNVIGKLRGNFFTTNLDVARAAFEQLPWVRHAGVRRVWPDQLAVTLEAYKALGTWGGDQLVSEQGELFTANQGELSGTLPALNGPDGSAPDVVARYRDFSNWFAPLHLKPTEVTLSPRYAWTVKLSNGMQVELGRERDNQTLVRRIQRLIAAWPSVTQRWGSNIAYADMRYPNGFAISADNMKFLPDNGKQNPNATQAPSAPPAQNTKQSAGVKPSPNPKQSPKTTR